MSNDAPSPYGWPPQNPAPASAPPPPQPPDPAPVTPDYGPAFGPPGAPPSAPAVPPAAPWAVPPAPQYGGPTSYAAPPAAPPYAQPPAQAPYTPPAPGLAPQASTPGPTPDAAASLPQPGATPAVPPVPPAVPPTPVPYATGPVPPQYAVPPSGPSGVPPYAAQPPYAPQPGYPQPPYAPQSPYPPQPPYGPPPGTFVPGGTVPPKPKKTWIPILAGALAVLLVGGSVTAGVLASQNKPSVPTPTHSTTPKVTPTPTATPTPTPAISATDTVRAYIEAIAAGHATEALSYVHNAPTDRTFMTDDMLAAAMAFAPITDIVVAPDTTWTGDGTAVNATFKLGTEDRKWGFLLTENGTTWSFDAYFPDIAAGDFAVYGAGMTLSGMALDDMTEWGSTHPIWALTYQLTLNHPYLALGSDTLAIDSSISDPISPDLMSDVNITLSADGLKKLTADAKAFWKQCAESHEFDPPGCGFGISELEGGGTPDMTTLTYTITDGNLDNLEWALDYDLTAYADAPLTIKAEIQDTVGEWYDVTYDITSVSVDFTDPKAPDVWFN